VFRGTAQVNVYLYSDLCLNGKDNLFLFAKKIDGCKAKKGGGMLCGHILLL
jgi:hypothetical protein